MSDDLSINNSKVNSSTSAGSGAGSAANNTQSNSKTSIFEQEAAKNALDKLAIKN